MSISHHPDRVKSRDTTLAWLSLLGFVLTFVLAFLIGEGLSSALGYEVGGAEEPPLWVILAASIPALVAFVLPAGLAWFFGRRALHAGDRRALVPMVLALVVAGGFVLQNVVLGVITLLT